MKRTILAGLATLLVAGCTTVSHAPLAPERSTQLNGKTFAATQYPLPDFTAFTAGKAGFALIGAVAMIAEGNEIVKTNSITDPAQGIGKALVDRLVAARNGKPVDTANGPSKSDDLAALATANPGADYLVDVKTLNWLFTYYPTDWAHYRVIYVARARLIETATRTVVAETACQAVEGDDKNPPTKAQLLEKQATLLKAYLDKAAANCVNVLTKDMLRL